ncbi:sirohydrochlorin chelatase, partial [Nocardia cyriacigeorgica]|nr:sirohydrochlorin chelatase [Nocardia cyriacigeorgica]
DLVHADTLGAHPMLAEVVWDRYDAAIEADLELSA